MVRRHQIHGQRDGEKNITCYCQRMKKSYNSSVYKRNKAKLKAEGNNIKKKSYLILTALRTNMPNCKNHFNTRDALNISDYYVMGARPGKNPTNNHGRLIFYSIPSGPGEEVFFFFFFLLPFIGRSLIYLLFMYHIYLCYRNEEITTR